MRGEWSDSGAEATGCKGCEVGLGSEAMNCDDEEVEVGGSFEGGEGVVA